jgi:3-phosphoshikimate 1-carboxyvinyltransferase
MITLQPGVVLHGEPVLPGAKYATVRAVLAAALATGNSAVEGLPRTEDTLALLDALTRLGISCAWTGPEQITIEGCGGQWPVAAQGKLVELDVGNAGAVLRLLLGATATLPEVRFVTRYPESLGKRPNADLLAALRHLGVAVTAREPGGLLPITLHGAGLHGGEVQISGALSSQYISALLFLGPRIGEPLTITITDALRSASFIRLTLAMLAQAGIVVDHQADLRRLHIPSPQSFQPRTWRLPRDFPTAATWLVAGALAGGVVTLHGLPRDTEDGAAVLAALQAFGASITTDAGVEPDQMTLTVTGGASLHGAVIDGESIIDSVPVLAALACFAQGTTTFTNVATLRLKESNRIDDLCQELCRAGAQAVPGASSITIIGQPEGVAGGVTVDAHHDHRLAMALALVALRAHTPITITGTEHVAKSYPQFWDELARLGATVQN